MKYYVKRELVAAPRKYFMKDVDGNDIFLARGKMGLSVGLQVTVFDKDQVELGRVDQKKLSLKPIFYIQRGRTVIGTLDKKFTAIKQKYELAELGWEIEGDFTAHEYHVSDKTGIIAEISKEWLVFGDSYEIRMKSDAHLFEMFCLVMAIDEIYSTQGNGWKVDNKGIEDFFR